MVTENILHNFRGYTYTISLKSLSAREYNNAYRHGFNMQNGVVLKSTGTGGNSKRISGATNLDYVVNRLEIDSLMAYNRKTRTSNTTEGRMEIFEPYSMMFLEDLQAMARYAGFGTNYLQAPYLLSIHFQPSTDHNFKNDANSGASSNMIKHIPIKLVACDFEVNASGATYDLSFIPYNAMATMDSIAYSKIAQTVNMKVLGELKDFADKLTAHESEYADKENLTTPNKYEIQMNEDLVNVPMGFVSTSLDNPQVKSIKAPVAEPANPNLRAGARESNQLTVGDTIPEADRKALADEAALVAQENARFGGAASGVVQVQSVSRTLEDGRIITQKVPQRNESAFDPNKDFQVATRGMKFQRGQDILGILDQVMQNSEYCTRIFEEDAKGNKFVSDGAINNGKVDWYQIVPQIEIIAQDNGGNSPAYKVKYMIHKSTIDANLLITDTHANINGYDIVRTYDYLYTGKNDDILDFRIKYNALFYQAAQMYSNQAKAENKDAPKAAGSNRQNNIANFFTTLADNLFVDGQGKVKMQGFNREEVNPVVVRSGDDVKDDPIDNSSKNVGRAKHLADILADPAADLIELDMAIIGDPVYILTKEYFNDGQKMGQQIIQNEQDLGSTDGMVYVNVNFKQPERGDIDQSRGVIPVTKKAVFSGVYRLTIVNNVFENGLFTQSLQGVRVKNQGSGQTGTSVGSIFRTVKNIFNNDTVEQKANKDYYPKMSGTGPSRGY